MKKRIIYLIIVLGIFASNIDAKVYKASVKSKFDDELDRHELAAALFYRYNLTKPDPHIGKVRDDFRKASQGDDKKEAEVGFIEVNADKNPELAKEFGVDADATIILFDESQPVKDKKETIIKLTGYPSKKEIRDFINEHLGDDIQESLEQDEMDIDDWDFGIDEEMDID